jgi:predicted phage-related endonuclease
VGAQAAENTTTAASLPQQYDEGAKQTARARVRLATSALRLLRTLANSDPNKVKMGSTGPGGTLPIILAAFHTFAAAPGVLECKTANAFSAHGWGEPGSDRVPAAYLAQCAWYTAVTGCAWADLAVLIGNSDFRVYRLARDPELEALVLGRARAFWYENVLAQRPPTARTASDAATLVPRSAPGSRVEATADVLEALQGYRARQAQLQALTEESESLKARVLAHMGEAEALSHAGRTLATWRSARASQRLDTRSLEAEHPELAARYRVSVSGSRRFLLREGA